MIDYLQHGSMIFVTLPICAKLIYFAIFLCIDLGTQRLVGKDFTGYHFFHFRVNFAKAKSGSKFSIGHCVVLLNSRSDSLTAIKFDRTYIFRCSTMLLQFQIFHAVFQIFS